MHKSIKNWSVLAAALTLFAVVAVACAAPQTPNDNGEGNEQVSALQTQLAEASEGGADDMAATLQAELDAAQATLQAQENQPEATDAPVGEDRTGGWFDTIVIVEEPGQDAGIERMLAGDIDIYMFATGDPEIYNKILDNDDTLNTVRSVGNYNELTFNPSGPTFANGKLNPFSNPKIREAMNMLVDRDYISQEIYGGLAQPRFTAVGTASSDYVTYIDVIRQLETKYAYNVDRVNEILDTELTGMGATKDGDAWMFNDEPLEIIVLIRTEDKRRDIGDYFSNQLESVGFTVVRDYKTAAEASACWVRTDPTEGCFHVYTAGWISTAISRDEGTNFGFFYTPLEQLTVMSTSYTPTEEFQAAADALWVNDFSTLEERRELFATALPLSLENSQRVMLIDQITVTAFRNEIIASGDLAGGVSGSRLWPFTLRREGEVGGSLNVAMPSILTEPWNPIGGSNWIYDSAIQRATGENATVFDPFTGLSLPHRLESAEVQVVEGIPVGSTLDWVTLEVVDSIEVPGDAWADWDAVNQQFITVDELAAQPPAEDEEATAEPAETGPVTAKSMIRVHYPADLFDTVTWHDGSPLSTADFVMGMILAFDQGKADSPYYDESQAPLIETFLSQFKGVRIVSESPLVIETYTDAFGLDAEDMVRVNNWFPAYTFGQASWHAIAIGLRAEGAGEAAFTAAKAEAGEVERLSYLAGPTIEILNTNLTAAAEEGFIPYAPTLGQYVSADDAAARYANLTEWYRRRGNFWVGTGPYFLQKAFPVEGTVILEANPNYPDPANRYSAFSTAPIPEVVLDGPSEITIGDEASYTATVTFNGEPYAAEDIKQVIVLVYDAEGNLVQQTEASGGDGGVWDVTFPTDDLPAGSNKVEVVVVSNRVGLPVFASQQFVTSE